MNGVEEEDVLYVVMHSEDGRRWRIARNAMLTETFPAAYQSEERAERYRARQASMFPHHHYRVAVFVQGS